MYGIIKGDARYQELSKMLPSVISSDLCDFYNVDDLILPLSGIDEYYNIKQSNINLLDILRDNDIKSIVVGNANDRLRELCQKKNIQLIELLNDRDYVRENAKLTALGILDYLSTGIKCVWDYKIIILGYGNIGFYLAKFLSALKGDFQVYGSNELERKFIELEGLHLADFKEFDIVINTIPSNLDWEYQLFKGKRIIDVASYPYGFDVSILTRFGIQYEIVSAVPAKYASESAAKIVKKTIEKYKKN